MAEGPWPSKLLADRLEGVIDTYGVAGNNRGMIRVDMRRASPATRHVWVVEGHDVVAPIPLALDARIGVVDLVPISAKDCLSSTISLSIENKK